MNIICGKRNRGNPNGIRQKYDPDGQRWIAYIIDPNNMTASSHDRTLAGCILEKNCINGLNNILDDFSCYFDIKSYIEKTLFNRTWLRLLVILLIYSLIVVR